MHHSHYSSYRSYCDTSSIASSRAIRGGDESSSLLIPPAVAIVEALYSNEALHLSESCIRVSTTSMESMKVMCCVTISVCLSLSENGLSFLSSVRNLTYLRISSCSNNRTSDDLKLLANKHKTSIIIRQTSIIPQSSSDRQA